MITASLNNYRQSPRKVRLVASLIRGKGVDAALNTLENITKRSTGPLQTLINSALANAKHNFNIEREALIIKDLRVDGGQILKRRMPRARGSAYPINKRTSHISLVLAPKTVKPVKADKSSK